MKAGAFPVPLQSTFRWSRFSCSISPNELIVAYASSYDAVLFGAAAIMFIMHCVPVYESDSLPDWWYPTIYYGVLIASSILAGGAIAIVVLLYLAVKDVIQVVAPGKTEHRYAVETDEKTSGT